MNERSSAVTRPELVSTPVHSRIGVSSLQLIASPPSSPIRTGAAASSASQSATSSGLLSGSGMTTLFAQFGASLSS